MVLHELIARVEDAGIAVAWADLRSCNGGWDAGTNTIWLRNGLDSRPRHARSVLAHEVAHSWFGHVGPQPAHEEVRADQWAASWLICPAKFRRAELMYEGDVFAMAVELDVTVRLVEAYRQVLAGGGW